MKKRILLFLCCLLVMVTLTGCSGWKNEFQISDLSEFEWSDDLTSINGTLTNIGSKNYKTAIVTCEFKDGSETWKETGAVLNVYVNTPVKFSINVERDYTSFQIVDVEGREI